MNLDPALAKAPQHEKSAVDEPAESAIPKVDGLKYNGIQKDSGAPGQYVFTDEKTWSTFYTKDLSEKNLVSERDRVRKKFEETPDVLAGPAKTLYHSRSDQDLYRRR